MIQWKKYWKYDVRFIFNDESDYPGENKSDNEDFCSTIFSTISSWAWTEKTCGNDSHEKKTKHIYASAADSLHIRIGNLNCGHCKNESGEIDCFFVKR